MTGRLGAPLLFRGECIPRAGLRARRPFRKHAPDPAPDRGGKGRAGPSVPIDAGFRGGLSRATYPFRDPSHAAVFTDGLRKAGWRDEASRLSLETGEVERSVGGRSVTLRGPDDLAQALQHGMQRRVLVVPRSCAGGRTARECPAAGRSRAAPPRRGARRGGGTDSCGRPRGRNRDRREARAPRGSGDTPDGARSGRQPSARAETAGSPPGASPTRR